MAKQGAVLEAEMNRVQSKLNEVTEHKRELEESLPEEMDTDANDKDFEFGIEECKRRIKRVELKLRDLTKKMKDIAEGNSFDIEAKEKHEQLIQQLKYNKKSVENAQNCARKFHLFSSNA